MKKTIMYLKSVAVCGIMAAAFIGCGGNSDSSGSSKSQQTPDPKEENHVDSLAVIAELNTEYETAQLQFIQFLSYRPELHQRYVMTVMINRRGEIMTEIDGNWHLCPIESVKNRTITFLSQFRQDNIKQLATFYPAETILAEEKPSSSNDNEVVQEEETVELETGDVIFNGFVVLLKHDETPLDIYNNVKKQLFDAILEMRNTQSEKYYGRSYFQLPYKGRQVVGWMIPFSIFETTPEKFYDQTLPPPVPEPELIFEDIDAVSEEEIIAAEASYYEQFPEEEEAVEEVVKVPDVDPEFPGGMDALYKYLVNNIKYPKVAQENGISGKVYVTFVVEKDGRLTEVKVLRDIGGGCGAEAVRVVKTMPKWKPGKNGGRVVRTQFNLPVIFTQR